MTAAFAYAVKLGGVKPRQTFVKKVITNHKFAEMKSKFFPNFLAALVYYDHLWELFDLADDNIDDDRYLYMLLSLFLALTVSNIFLALLIFLYSLSPM